MEEAELKKYEKAAEIEKKVFEELRVEQGMKILDLVEGIEKKIVELGGKPAFPVNISCNDIAAHDTASVGDERTIGEKDIVKVDIGVHVDGFIADSAVTFDLSGENGKLMEAAKRALEDAVSMIKAGVKTNEIGSVVEKAIKERGFQPIENLTGHALAEYNLHAGIEVPNYAARAGDELKEGTIVAIEPFATNGRGYVIESSRCEIFSALLEMPSRLRAAREMFKKIQGEYRLLPFAERWVAKDAMARVALRELVKNQSLIRYPVLKEKVGGLVTQFEHTVVVEKDAARILI